MIALITQSIPFGIMSHLPLPYLSVSFLVHPAVLTALEAAPDADSESCVEKAGSLCGLGAVLAASSSSSSSSSSLPYGLNPSKAVKQNTSIQSLPDLEFGTVPVSVSVGNNSRTDSPRSLGLDSDSSHPFREFDQMCSRTIGGTVGSFRIIPKEKEGMDREKEKEKEKDSILSKEAKEFLNMLPDYGYLVF